MSDIGCRLKQIVQLVYDTIREPHVTLPVPVPVARLLAMPREKLFRTVRLLLHCSPSCARGWPPCWACIVDCCMRDLVTCHLGIGMQAMLEQWPSVADPVDEQSSLYDDIRLRTDSHPGSVGGVLTPMPVFAPACRSPSQSTPSSRWTQSRRPRRTTCCRRGRAS